MTQSQVDVMGKVIRYAGQDEYLIPSFTWMPIISYNLMRRTIEIQSDAESMDLGSGSPRLWTWPCHLQAVRALLNHLTSLGSAAPSYAKLLQSCPTLCDPMDCSLPGSSVPGILWARILEWVAMPFSRASSWLRDQTASLKSSALAGGFFTTRTTLEASALGLSSVKWGWL